MRNPRSHICSGFDLDHIIDLHLFLLRCGLLTGLLEAEIWKFSSRLSRYRASGSRACDSYKDKGLLFQFDAAQDVSTLAQSIADTVIPLGGTGKLSVPWFDGRRTDQVHISGPKPLYTTLCVPLLTS